MGCALAAAVAVAFGAGAVFFFTTTGSQRSNAPTAAGSIPAGPGDSSLSPLSVGKGGSASGQHASAAAGGGASASSPPGSPATEASGSGEVSVSGGGPVPPPSVLPTSAPPPTPAGGAEICNATYSLVGSWEGGYQASVTVADSGSSPLNGWTVELTLANGQSISNLWSGVNSGTSGAITVKNTPYNGTVAAGRSATFGFTANGNGSAAPTSIGCVGP